MVEMFLKIFETDLNENKTFYYEFIPANYFNKNFSDCEVVEEVFEKLLKYESYGIESYTLNKGIIKVLNRKTNEFEFIEYELVPGIKLNSIVFEIKTEVYNLSNVI